MEEAIDLRQRIFRLYNDDLGAGAGKEELQMWYQGIRGSEIRAQAGGITHEHGAACLIMEQPTRLFIELHKGFWRVNGKYIIGVGKAKFTR